MNIPFNKPYLTGKELTYIKEAVEAGKISGNGMFTQKCHDFFCEKYNFKKVLLTTSCTDALEMSAILLDIMPGDEVIVPSFTFVSSANAFVLRGAKIKFADSLGNNPNIDPGEILRLITPKTKAIVVVHYAGVACQMNEILKIANDKMIPVIEDAAQSIDSFFEEKPLGTMGALSTFSFHETKNIISGEGGMLAINDEELFERAEIIWEKGTNRTAMKRGEVDKYGWVDIGSSFLPSEITAAFLYAQLEELESIQARRIFIWEKYYSSLKPLEDRGYINLPELPSFATNNGHLFYIVCNDNITRDELIKYLNDKGILAVFHYLSLNQSPYYLANYEGFSLPNSERFEKRLVRLPLYYEINDEQLDIVINQITSFFEK